MSHHRTTLGLALGALLLLLTTACGSTNELVAGDDSGGSSETSSASTGVIAQISEQDLDQARANFDAAKAAWEERKPPGFVFRAGVESINMIEIVFDADGVAAAETVVFGEADPEGWASVPRSVEEAFDEVEELLVRFESGEWPVPDPDDCGSHFTADFDPELGAPGYYDTLGPCDDGVGIRIEVIPEGVVADAPVIAAAPCLETDFYGTWQSVETDSSAEAEVSLTLADGGSSLTVEGTTEPVGEWFCADGQIVAIRDTGEEWPLASINEDGTLTVSGVAVTKTN